MGLWKWMMGEEPSIIEQILHGGDKGEFGEYLTKYAIDSLAGYFKTLQNIYLPHRGGTSEIDVLLIHEKGIFVFESKNYSGWIFGSSDSKNWTQCLNGGKKTSFYNPILQNKTHINALNNFIKLQNDIPVVSYIIFSERCEFKKIPENTDDVVILRRPNLIKVLKNDIKRHPPVLTREQIDDLYNMLTPLTNVSAETRQAHIANIENTHKKPVNVSKVMDSNSIETNKIDSMSDKTSSDSNLEITLEPLCVQDDTSSATETITKMICPRCGSDMIKRTASKGENKGNIFWGCSNFPKCRCIVNPPK